MYKKDFPLLRSSDIIYLDSASTTQKPEYVIRAIEDFLQKKYANIHRGDYDLSVNASREYEHAKQKIAEFLGGESYAEVVITYNATYAMNLIARSLIKSGMLARGDHVLVSLAEHHANIVPWQIIAEEYGIIVDYIALDSRGLIDYDDLARQLPNAKVLAITGASNVTGEILDIAKVRNIIKQQSSRPLWIMDGTQRFAHMTTDVERSGIDIFVATGHKIFADTGIGFFFARKELLKTLVPPFCGGGAINRVTTEGYDPAGLPFRFEPGTPHIVGAISLLAALEYIESIGGYDAIRAYEQDLITYFLEKIPSLPEGVRLIGSGENTNRLGVFSFIFTNRHPIDVAEALADRSISVRAGHHCAEPLHTHLGVVGSLRVSLAIYNSRSDIDEFFDTFSDILS